MTAARVAIRGDTARALAAMATQVDQQLANLTDEQRQQTLIKVEHEKPVDLVGTGLKLIGPQGNHVSLAVLKPGETNLGKLQQKINEFGTGALERGQPKHKQLDGIQKIEKGKPTDRLSDGLFAAYPELIASDDLVTIEVEMTSLLQGANQQRRELEAIRNDLQRMFGMAHGHFHEHEEYGNVCRAVIQCSGSVLQRLVESPAWVRRIMWFEERPRFKSFQETVDDFQMDLLGEVKPPDDDAAVVCVIDSGVTPKNPLLEPVVRPRLLQSFLSSDPDNPYDSFGHGSGVASLVAYNAINIAEGAVNEGKVWIASARIVTEDNELEDERLFSSLLREVVTHFKPKGVRIFNLSIGNCQLKWNQTSRRTADRKSWVARTIDQLSREHDIVFVTCTGNILCPEINRYLENGFSYPAYFSQSGAEILDPGQAALALTTGSIAASTTVANNSSDTAVAATHQPSPFTRCGPGIKNEMKPELVEYGGNYASAPDGRVRTASGLHVVVATHQQTPAITHDCGTSLAAPRVAHKMAIVLRDLERLGVENPSSALLKAFVVNSATYPLGKEAHRSFVEIMDGHKKGHWHYVLGYGTPDASRATDCDDFSCLLFFDGHLDRNKVAFFQVPVPREMSGAGKKRLTVTVCSTPEVQKTGLTSYLGTTTTWRMFRGDVSHEEVVAAMSKEQDEEGGDDEEDEGEEGGGPKELKFSPGIKRRSRGTVQHGAFEWTQHDSSFSDHHYTLAVASYEKWGRPEGKAPSLPYAVVVRLEDLSRMVEVYGRVTTMIPIARQKTTAPVGSRPNSDRKLGS